MPVTKDEKRIYDIRSKGGTDRFLMERLARTQANRITDIPKCRRRYEAALEILGEGHPVTATFRTRYDSLRGVVLRDPVVPVVSTDTFNEAMDLSDSLEKTVKEKQKIKAELKLKDGKVTGKIVVGKAENTVDDYIAFFRK